MKRSISIVVVLLLLCASLGCMAGLATSDDTWTCSNCGSTVSGNFCSNCGNPKPEDPDDIVFDDVEQEQGNIVEYYPTNDMWEYSLDDVDYSNAAVEACKIGKKQGVRVSNIEIDSYTMDGYFVFGEKKLEKMVFLLADTGKHSKSELESCYNTFVEDMMTVAGSPDTQTEAVTTWEKENFTIQIGTGKFKNYTGSDNSSVGIVYKHTEADKSDEGEKQTTKKARADYKLLRDYKWETYIYYYEGLVIKNTSGATKDFNAQVMFYDEKNNLIGVGNYSADVVGNGKEALIECSNETPFHHIEYSITARDTRFHEVQSFVTVQIKKTDDKAIIIANNNGTVAANYLKYQILFLNKNKEVVRSSWGYLTDDDSQLKPGMTEFREETCKEPFKSVEIYYTGRY